MLIYRRDIVYFMQKGDLLYERKNYVRKIT